MKTFFLILAALLALVITQLVTAQKPAPINMGDTGRDVIAAVAADPIRIERKVILGLPIEILVFNTGLTSELVVTLVQDRVVATEKRETKLLNIFH